MDLTSLGTSCTWNPAVFVLCDWLISLFHNVFKAQNFLSQSMSLLRDGLALTRAAGSAFSFHDACVLHGLPVLALSLLQTKL